jgi:hypothetical protein
MREADHAAQRAIALDPESAFAWAVYANVLNSDARPQAGEHAASRALELAPGELFALEVRARSRLLRGDAHGALEDIEVALTERPDEPTLLELRATTLAHLRKPDEAAAMVSEALRIQPESAATLTTLGWQLLRQGEVDEAVVAMRDALSIDPGDRHARRGLIESMKARNPVYGRVIRAQFWIAPPLPLRRCAVIAAVVLSGFGLLMRWNAGEAPLVAILMLMAAFLLLTSARSVSDLGFWLTSRGRVVILRDEFRLGLLTCSALALSAVLAGVWWVSSDAVWAFASVSALFYPGLARPAIEAPAGPPRQVARALAVILPLVTTVCVVLVVTGVAATDPDGKVPGALAVLLVTPVMAAWIAPGVFMSSTFRSLPIGVTPAQAVTTGLYNSRWWWYGVGLLLGLFAITSMNRAQTKTGGFLVMGIIYAVCWAIPRCWGRIRDLGRDSVGPADLTLIVLTLGMLIGLALMFDGDREMTGRALFILCLILAGSAAPLITGRSARPRLMVGWIGTWLLLVLLVGGSLVLNDQTTGAAGQFIGEAAPWAGLAIFMLWLTPLLGWLPHVRRAVTRTFRTS